TLYGSILQTCTGTVFVTTSCFMVQTLVGTCFMQVSLTIRQVVTGTIFSTVVGIIRVTVTGTRWTTVSGTLRVTVYGTRCTTFSRTICTVCCWTVRLHVPPSTKTRPCASESLVLAPGFGVPVTIPFAPGLAQSPPSQ